MTESRQFKPLTGRPEKILPKLAQLVSNLIQDSQVESFYIGRTDNPVGRCSAHGADLLVPIYRTDSPDYALQVEDTVIKIFLEHPKCENDAPHSGGSVSTEFSDYVYVALWYR